MPEPRLPTGLLQLTPMDPTFRACPHTYLDRLRAADPMHVDRELGRLFPTRAKDVRAVVSNRALSSDSRKASWGRTTVSIGDAPIETVELTMLHLDDPDHRRIRGLVPQAFNQRAAEAARPRIRAIAEHLLERLAGRDAFDVIANYAAPLPIIVIAGMLGWTRRTFRNSSAGRTRGRTQIFNSARTAEQTADLVAAGQQLNELFLRMIAAGPSRAAPRRK